MDIVKPSTDPLCAQDDWSNPSQETEQPHLGRRNAEPETAARVAREADAADVSKGHVPNVHANREGSRGHTHGVHANREGTSSGTAFAGGSQGRVHWDDGVQAASAQTEHVMYANGHGNVSNGAQSGVGETRFYDGDTAQKLPHHLAYTPLPIEQAVCLSSSWRASGWVCMCLYTHVLYVAHYVGVYASMCVCVCVRAHVCMCFLVCVFVCMVCMCILLC